MAIHTLDKCMVTWMAILYQSMIGKIGKWEQCPLTVTIPLILHQLHVYIHESIYMIKCTNEVWLHMILTKVKTSDHTLADASIVSQMHISFAWYNLTRLLWLTKCYCFPFFGLVISSLYFLWYMLICQTLTKNVSDSFPSFSPSCWSYCCWVLDLDI